MPQSLSLVIVHYVFSTKDRYPFLHDQVRPDLLAYLSTVARNVGGECYRAGGVADHVHLAIRQPRTVSISELVEELKTSSSKWIKTQDPKLASFSWQRGYGAFSAYYREIDRLLGYIDGQEEHHRKRDFKEEFRGLLDEHEIEYDERYVWD